VYNRFLAGAAGLTLPQWNQFWWLPAGFAAFVTIFFALAFRDRTVDQAEPAASRAA
jgi:hypothetical protein